MTDTTTIKALPNAIQAFFKRLSDWRINSIDNVRLNFSKFEEYEIEKKLDFDLTVTGISGDTYQNINRTNDFNLFGTNFKGRNGCDYTLTELDKVTELTEKLGLLTSQSVILYTPSSAFPLRNDSVKTFKYLYCDGVLHCFLFVRTWKKTGYISRFEDDTDLPTLIERLDTKFEKIFESSAINTKMYKLFEYEIQNDNLKAAFEYNSTYKISIAYLEEPNLIELAKNTLYQLHS